MRTINTRALILGSRGSSSLWKVPGNGKCLFCGVAQNDKDRQKTAASPSPSASSSPGGFPRDFRDVFPDFLPHKHFQWRNPLSEKLERIDMLKRRQNLEVPEFYVGSILAVTVADRFSPGRVNRFLGICVARERTGLRHFFVLRNCFDSIGVEVRYDLYNPLIQKIELIKLEKRLDDNLLYLRDAMAEYSTFPMEMPPEPHPIGAPVPVNPLKVKLRPPPWTMRWELQELRGVEPFWDLVAPHRKRRYHWQSMTMQGWDKYDLVEQYREEVPREDQEAIWQEMSHLERKHLATVRGRRRPLLKHRYKTAL